MEVERRGKVGGRGTCERVDDGGLRCGYAGGAQGLCGGYSEECEVDFRVCHISIILFTLFFFLSKKGPAQWCLGFLFLPFLWCVMVGERMGGELGRLARDMFVKSEIFHWVGSGQQ